MQYWDIYPPAGESLADIVGGLFEKQKPNIPVAPKEQNKSFMEQAAELAMWDARLR